MYSNFDKVKEQWEFDSRETFGGQICNVIRKIRGKSIWDCQGMNCNECKKWLQKEYKILDDVERKYLSAVIKPFRGKVDFIRKCKSIIDGKEYIEIFLNNDDNANLPDFSEGTMYKGMEADKKYTLAELGL